MYLLKKEKYEYTKAVIRIHKLKRTDNTMAIRKKDKQWSTKHYTEKHKSSNTNPTIIVGEPVSVSSFCSTRYTHRVTVKRHEHHLTWKCYWTSNKYKYDEVCSLLLSSDNSIVFID